MILEERSIRARLTGGCASTKQRIDRDSAEDDEKAGPGGGCSEGEENDEDEGGAEDVDGGEPGISPAAIGSRGVGAGAAEAEEACDGEDVEDERGGDDVVEEVAVEVAVGVGGGVVGAGQDEEKGPEALEGERPAGNLRLIESSGAAEEEAILRHGVAGTAAGESEGVHGAERRDHDEAGHR